MIWLTTKRGCPLPEYQTMLSAGCDVQARVQKVIASNTTEIIPTGLFIERAIKIGNKIPELQMRLRSSLAIDHNLIIPNGVGTIDADYKDEIGILIHNPNLYGCRIEKGYRIGQLILNYVHKIENINVKQEERKGGFGSTGR